MNDFYCDEVLSGNVGIEPIFETDNVLAFNHTHPFYERHVVIIPKMHIDSLSSAGAVSVDLAVDFIQTIQHVTAILESEEGGCRVSSNVGNYQTTKHLHWYVHAGKRLRDEDGKPVEV